MIRKALIKSDIILTDVILTRFFGNILRALSKTSRFYFRALQKQKKVDLRSENRLLKIYGSA